MTAVRMNAVSKCLKVNEIYLSKVMRYFYFVTSQHWFFIFLTGQFDFYCEEFYDIVMCFRRRFMWINFLIRRFLHWLFGEFWMI